MSQRLVGLSASVFVAFTQLYPATPGLAGCGCPEPVKQLDHDVRAQIQGQLSTIGRLGAGQIEAKTERTAQDLLSKYPNADRVAVVQNFVSIFCNQLQQSKSLSEGEKFDLTFRMYDKIKGMFAPDSPNVYFRSDASEGERKAPGFISK